MNEDDGEIAPLDASPLSEDMAHEDQPLSEDPDERALRRISDRLRVRGGRTEEQIEDLAADMYNAICKNIRSDQMSSGQLLRAAELLGEDPQDLRERLQ